MISFFSWAVTIAVNLGVKVIYIFTLSLILGKSSLVIVHFVVLSHSWCHISMDVSLSLCFTSLLGIFFPSISRKIIEFCALRSHMVCLIVRAESQSEPVRY
jgi:hypothetical protein